MNVPTVQANIDSLKQIYTIVLALAIGEGFKQFVVDRSARPEERHVQWDRFPALLSFLLLVIPFYHGIVRYFFEAYNAKPLPSPYGLWLSVDCLAFMIEAILFFVLSRSLSLLQWQSFYKTVMLLCGFDALWVFVDQLGNQPTLQSWIVLDVVNLVGIAAVFLIFRKGDFKTVKWISWPAMLPVLVILTRTVADYGMNHEYYFPANAAAVSNQSTPPAVLPNQTGRVTRVYFAGPLFSQAQWQWNERLADVLKKTNYEVILPQQRAEPMLKGTEPFDALTLFEENRRGIDRANVVLAILDEADPDSGTSWECGYAYKVGVPVVGLRTDIRRVGDDPNASVNLMLSQSCKTLVQVPYDRINDLQWVAKHVTEAIKSVHP